MMCVLDETGSWVQDVCVMKNTEYGWLYKYS